MLSEIVDAEKRNDHEQAANRYLEKVANSYILDASDGIYKPKPEPAERGANENPYGSHKTRPLWVSIVRDWPIFLVSVATLVLLVATVHYTRKQWIAMNDTLCKVRKQTGYAKETATNAGKSAQAAIDANDSTRRMFQARFIMWPLLHLERNRVDIAIKNVGKTTAANISAHGRLEIAPIVSNFHYTTSKTWSDLGLILVDGTQGRELNLPLPAMIGYDGPLR